MHITRRATYAALFTIVSSITLAQNAHAQLPTVQQVYDKFATAVGGRDAWAKVTDRAEKGIANLVFANISGTYERYYSAPNKMRLIIDLGVGKVEQGTDGTVVWSGQPDGSVSKMGEPDASYSLEANVTGAAFLDITRFAKAEVVGQEDFDGVPCYKVAITTKAGRERADYFEVATGLRRGQVVKSPAGEQKTAFREYQEFDKKKVATKQILTNAQGDIIITLTSVVFTPNDPKLFALPAGIAK